jgi:hypothetical protein
MSDNDNRPAPGAGANQSKADKAAESAPGERQPGEDLDQRQEDLVDEAVEETFPASDPISPKHIT